MSERRILLSFAHPDDESFGSGGLIAKSVAQGIDVYLICATNGDAGTVKPELLNGYASIAELRLAELECAARTLGFKEVITFGYRDSGMMGSATSQDSGCLWQAPQADVVHQVVKVIRRVKPQVVITFNKFGGYGHPDHIAIQRATTEAFFLAGDSTYQTPELSAYTPQKLYYTSIPVTLLRLGITLMRLRGQDPRKVGVNNDIDLQAILDHVEPIHSKINIGDYYAAWDQASECHKSQLGGRSLNLPLWLRRFMSPWQGLTRVYPPPQPRESAETDLFAATYPDKYGSEFE